MPSSSSPPTTELDDADALERLRERLRLFAARRLGNWDEAEDVAQEAIRRAIESLRAGRVQNPQALPAFCFQTVVHVCQHRSLSAGREAKALRRFASEDGTSSEASDPLHGLISDERRAAVRRAIDQLDAGDRDLLTLSFVETQDAASIGRRLGLSSGNVRVRRHRALRRLAELLRVTEAPEKGHK